MNALIRLNIETKKTKTGGGPGMFQDRVQGGRPDRERGSQVIFYLQGLKRVYSSPLLPPPPLFFLLKDFYFIINKPFDH